MSLQLRPPNLPPIRPIQDAVLAQRTLLFKAGAFTFVNGMLLLVPQWFMFEVYGRVLNSRNAATLGWLLLLTVGAYLLIELLEVVRSRVLWQVGERVDTKLRKRLFDSAFEAYLRRLPVAHQQAFTDLRTVREFIGSPAVAALMDIPASLVMLLLLFLLSPWLGMMALVGLLLQMGLMWSTEKRTMPQLMQANRAAIQAQSFASGMLRNAQVIESMGMLGAVRKCWLDRQRAFIVGQASASDHAGLTATVAKLIQTMQGSLLLGMACWLALHNNLFGGGAMMIVASILGGRVLAPTAQLVGSWRLVVGVRDATRRLNGLLALFADPEAKMSLPAPKGLLTVEGVTAGAPGSQGQILRNVSFIAQPGEVVVVSGPSASGKTSLVRLLVGIWPAMAGKVRLDGADVYGWDKSELGPHVGYVPQAIELFDGTVADNIARFGIVDDARVREAAAQVGLTDTIEQLPQGFDTPIGDDGAVLSGGQRQRLALARAIYGNPQLIVMDEPNASLDETGEQQLVALLQGLKARGATVVVVTHRAGLLAVADKLLVLADGQVAAFGPRDDVLAALKKAGDQARAQVQARAAQALRGATGAPAP